MILKFKRADQCEDCGLRPGDTHLDIREPAGWDDARRYVVCDPCDFAHAVQRHPSFKPKHRRAGMTHVLGGPAPWDGRHMLVRPQV